MNVGSKLLLIGFLCGSSVLSSISSLFSLALLLHEIPWVYFQRNGVAIDQLERDIRKWHFRNCNF
uniref:Uncharacterized protein n=1 Tax=Rhizophora mucronata TaxID=61149 RepID=A0A2P2NZG8_RHIMU